MTSSVTPKNDNVVQLRAPTSIVEGGPRSEAALYIGQIALELEQLANTTGMELVGYFLALARAEAETYARASAPKVTPSQAPYRVD
ncbi:MAG: hypothetical protein JWN07_2357 [Hyphomicrobiales bacterium]|nr:hypothetical protein [Hyphomicrobiales bacterium]